MPKLTDEISESTKLFLGDVANYIKEGRLLVIKEESEQLNNQFIDPESVPLYAANLITGGYVAFLETNGCRIEIERSKSLHVLREDIELSFYLLRKPISKKLFRCFREAYGFSFESND